MNPARIDSRHAPTVGPANGFESAVRDHCDQLLCSPHFDASERSRQFLQFVIAEALAGRGDSLNQTSIAMAVFGRDSTFDAVMDPIVRVQAGRLRRSLERFYLLTGSTNSFRIELAKGKYAPSFVEAAVEDFSEPTLDVHEPDDRPMILVPSFETTSSVDADSAARLNEELALELSRYGTVRVICKRDLGDVQPVVAPRFELRGSLRRTGKDCTVRASLIDKKSSIQLWGDEFHAIAPSGQWPRNLGDIGRVIAARVACEHGIVPRQVMSESGVQPMRAIQRSRHFVYSGQADEVIPAIHALQRLTVCEPENARGWIKLARLRLANYAYELTDLPTPIEATIGFAYQGVMLDPMGARAACVLVSALLVKGELEAAREIAWQTLRHNGDSFVHREALGCLLAMSGDWDRGMEVVRDTASRNPCCLAYVQHALWADCLRRGEADKAYVAALEYRDVSGFWPQLMVASCLGNLGRLDEARVSVAELLAAKPQFASTGRRLVGHFIKPSDLSALIFDGLAKAGLDVT